MRDGQVQECAPHGGKNGDGHGEHDGVRGLLLLVEDGQARKECGAINIIL